MKQEKTSGIFTLRDAKWDTVYWLDRANIETPRNGYLKYENHWWLTNEDGQVAFYGTEPQSALSPEVLDLMMKYTPGATDKVQIPVAHVESF